MLDTHYIYLQCFFGGFFQCLKLFFYFVSIFYHFTLIARIKFKNRHTKQLFKLTHWTRMVLVMDRMDKGMDKPMVRLMLDFLSTPIQSVELNQIWEKKVIVLRVIQFYGQINVISVKNDIMNVFRLSCSVQIISNSTTKTIITSFRFLFREIWWFKNICLFWYF